MLSEKFNGKKNAGITIEITLSVALMIVVIFLAIGLFNDNIQNMAAKAGINKLFNRTALTDKSSWGEATKSTSSQINVQTIAEQGLQYYVSQAQATVDKYKDKTDLTPAEMEDLAKALTVLSVNKGSTVDFSSILQKFEINILLENSNNYDASGNRLGVTTLKNGKTINYISPESKSDKLTIVKDVISKNF